jgi:hypothetical protein
MLQSSDLKNSED